MKFLPRHPRVALLSSESVFRGVVFDVLRERVRLPSGLEQDLAVVTHDGAVCVAAVRDDGRLVLVRQYRHALGEWMLELPAGRLESSEDSEVAARRELEEETGLRAREWTELRRFVPAPGFCSERLTLFEARGLEPVPGGGLAPDDDEELEVTALTPREILADRSIQDAKTLLAAALLVS